MAFFWQWAEVYSLSCAVAVWLQCKIVRVLNLWQKHGVYAPSVVQPLLDMAGDSLDDSFGSPRMELYTCLSELKLIIRCLLFFTAMRLDLRVPLSTRVWYAWLLSMLYQLARCRRGCLSGAKCRCYAYGPADVTATSLAFASVKFRMIYLSRARLPRFS